MISLILFGACVIIFIYALFFSRPKNFPPGPPRLPWLGSVIFMVLLDPKHLHRAAKRLCKFYKSSVIGLNFGNLPIVVVNDLENVKKLLNHRDFDGRPDILMARMRHPQFERHGIIFTDSNQWHEQRQFSVRHLREYGFGRRFDALEEEIDTQIAQYIDLVKNGPKYPHENKFYKDGQILLPYAFGPTISNCFMKVFLNQSIPREDMAELNKLIENSFKFQRNTDDYGKLYSLIPILATLFPELSGYKAGRDASISTFEFFSNIVNEQMKTFDESYERNFIDMYLNKMRQNESNPEEKTHFSIDQLVFTCMDFMLPVTSSLPQTIAFFLQQICHDPEMQRKIQNEIDDIVGDRSPTLDDRANMPYVEACIREILRYETLIPSGLPHTALCDTEFLGYHIPKGSLIMPALNAAMHDSSAWEHPNEFQPERFLDASGALSLSKDISVSFGAGRRMCPGETFARNMIFLFTTAFLQAFSVQMPAGEKPLDFNDNLTGTIRTSPDHWIQVTIR